MSSPDESVPYRHDLGAAYDRISSLESELAHARDGVSKVNSRALAGLRIRHLQEDVSDLVAGFHRRRSALFAATAVGMLGSFAAFVVLARVHPVGARSLWLLCGAVVTAFAATGWGTQTWLRARVRRAVRSLDRRIEEEHVLAGLEAVAAPQPRVRVTADPLEPEVEPMDPLLAETRARSPLC